MEHQEDRRFTRSVKQAGVAEFNKSAITDHARKENHVIDWEESRVVTKESDRLSRWIREAIAIRKTRNKAINRDIETYSLSHLYDMFLISAATYTTSSGNKTSMVRQRQQKLLKRL